MMDAETDNPLRLRPGTDPGEIRIIRFADDRDYFVDGVQRTNRRLAELGWIFEQAGGSACYTTTDPGVAHRTARVIRKGVFIL